MKDALSQIWHDIQQKSRLAIIVKKLLNIFAALPNCQSTGGVSIEMAKPICTFNKETKQTAECNKKWVKTFSFYDSCLKKFSDL
jgi:hypothetical protein